MTAVLSSASGPSLNSLNGGNGNNIYNSSDLSLGSQHSLGGNDEDVTIKMNRNISSGAPNSLDELQVLAISAQITEVTYSISDVQTRIFEIQELRHQSEAQQAPANGDGKATGESPTTNIDQALINLDERLEAITASIASIDAALAPLLASKTPTTATTSKTPTQSTISGDDSNSAILRKHASLLSEWDAVQEEAETLKGELREDKWLAVFRTVGEQAEAMMMSLEKAVSHCQDFIWTFQKNRRALTDDGHSGISSGSLSGDGKVVNYEMFQTLLSSYEAKKRYYMPATTKVLSILDRSVRDRVTKNGECLRRHAEARARWKNLRERINRIDSEMESLRLFFVNKDKEPEPSEAGSAVSRQTSKSNFTNKSNYLSTSSANRSRTGSSSGTPSAFSRSMSPFKRFASKVSASVRSGGTGGGRDSPATSRTGSVSGVSISNPKPLRPINVPDRSRPGLSNEPSTASTVSNSGSTSPVPRPPPRSPFRPMGNKISAVSSPGPQEETKEKKKRESNLFPFLSRPPPPSALGKSTSRAPSRSSMSGGDTSASSASKPRWNGSTRVEHDPHPPSQNATIRASPQRPSIMGQIFRPLTPTEGRDTGRRSLSRTGERERPATSMSRHTPWHSLSSGMEMNGGVTPARAGSRAGARTPSASHYGTGPRTRPVTPSNIPAPSYSNGARPPSRAASESDYEDNIPTSLMQRALSPATDIRGKTPEPKKRRPSNSMIPVPKLNVTSNSRPGTAMSMGWTDRSISPSLSSDANGRKSPKESPSAWRVPGSVQDSPSDLRKDARAGARSQTPEAMLRARAGVFLDAPTPEGRGSSPASGTSATPGTKARNGPSSFRGEGRTLVFGPGPGSGGASGSGGNKPPSRPGSRSTNYGFGRMTPTLDGGMGAPYVPTKTDELDVEVAKVINGMAHGFLFERIDPPRKTPAKAGEEVKAQYAVSNALGRKLITCRLVVVTRGGAQNKKVMCRVGGGWLELSMYILNRQAGLS